MRRAIRARAGARRCGGGPLQFPPCIGCKLCLRDRRVEGDAALRNGGKRRRSPRELALIEACRRLRPLEPICASTENKFQRCQSALSHYRKRPPAGGSKAQMDCEPFMPDALRDWTAWLGM